MKTKQELERFLREESIGIFSALTAAHKPRWGQMDPQNMIEHLGLTVRVSNGKRDVPQATPEDKVEKLRTISLLSDRPLPVNFQNPALGSNPQPYVFSSLSDATSALWNERDDFFSYYSLQPAGHTRIHNVFGALNYEHWLQFHYKHFMHHAMQFGLVPDFTRL